ncbi:Dephospho-CoA kinase [Polaribacter huanghezhanensis]|uniref:dephospho-CoA kinase n=1 Tax=Polaribacter huanghezhanensis TaxID=1354726 RepID=UPI002649902D|nr:dephospho-CoA kinase [Polaribacter huanghezhanensis]WKD86866.1 Dephospho-CoA kinase [Polaribacter huanghezhanensis]
MVVGLTGGIGSGKSTVARAFQKIGNVAVYFADDEAKKLMTTSSIIKNQICKEFGEKAYQENELNSAFIADVVFSNKEKLATLNSIVHPEVYTQFKAFVEANKDKEYVLYENAILFENASAILCDKIITVIADESIRIQRVVKRDNTSEIAVKNRIRNQWKDSKKALLSNYIITNNTSDNLLNQIMKIHNNLTQ